MIKSFRLRLTLWYLAFFSLLFALFGVFLYGVLSNALERRLEDTLLSQAATAASLFLDEMDELKGDFPRAAAEAASEMRLRGSTVAVFRGPILLSASGPLDRSELESAGARVSQDSGTDLVVPLPKSGKHGSLAAGHRVQVDGREYLTLAVEPLDSVAASLQAVRSALLFGMPFLLALAGAGGYWITTRGLAPLGVMASQSRQITDTNLHARLDIGNAADELKVLAASFNELLSRLDQSFESMRRFVADASHELRTPISVIRGEADVALSNDRGASEYRESLAIILDESRRLSRLVDDLLNLARADAGYVRLQVRDFYFNDLVGECCRAVQTLASVRDVAVECHAGGDVAFRGDEELLRRLVINLLDNAIRYTPSGGKVSVDLDASGPDVRVRVSDTGIGIAPDAAAHVFERFYRADKARTREQGGFGLGLSIVKWIAESHHGGIELDSRPEKGTTFTVTLPREAEESSRIQA